MNADLPAFGRTDLGTRPPGVRTGGLAGGPMDPVPKDVTCWSPPILRATDQTVGHSGYAWQTPQPTPDATPASSPSTRPKDPTSCSVPRGLGISHHASCRCASVHLVDKRPAKGPECDRSGALWQNCLPAVRGKAFDRFG